MAFASSLRKGQTPVCCYLCQTETKINWKCLPCKLFMCTKCKDNVHSKFRSADEHKIISIQELGLHSEYIDFSNIKCHDHAGQTCFMFCKSCDQLVCPQCISKVHNGHGLVEISEGYQIKVEKLKEGQTKAVENIDELTKSEIKLDILLMAEQGKFFDAKKRIQAQKEALKEVVDVHIENLMKELCTTWEKIQKTIEKEKDRVKPLKQNLNDQIYQTEDLINSNDAVKVFQESEQPSQSLNVVQQLDVEFSFIPMPRFVPGEITQFNVGSLQEYNDIDVTISKQYITGFSFVSYISTCSDGTLWISDGHVIQKVKPEDEKLKLICSFNMEIYSMAVTPSDDLLLASGPVLKQISGDNGELTDTLYRVDSLRITTVHVTNDFHVLLGAKAPGKVWPVLGRRVVIKINKDGTHEKTYEHDRNKQPIFSYVKHITSTTIGTIFVVDSLSEDRRGRLVILGQDGDVLNTYTGHQKINSDDKPFKPVCTVTTSSDNIIVTDPNTDTLHILDSLGQLITHYNSYNIGVQYPYSLTFTKLGKLFIGCNRAKGSTDKAKLYKVG